MANTNRLDMNRDGQMLIPMNVDGGNLDGKFLTSTKLCILFGIVFLDAGIVAWISQLYLGIAINIIVYVILFFLTQYIVRYFILEEKYYYRMYKKMEKYAVSNPSVFWGISSIRDTGDGAIMIYSDGKAGIMMRLDRDTITGKNSEFRETHFDSLSDFYKELNLKNLDYITISVMEPAGKDPRLVELDKLTVKSDNQNIRKLLEAEVGYIKTITRSTLFESDYVLILCNNIDRVDNLIHEALDCAYRLLEGGFVGYNILNASELIDRLKDEYGVKYFDYADATVNMYRNSGLNIGKALHICGVTYEDGTRDEVGNLENNRLDMLASYKNRGLLDGKDWTVRRTLRGNIIEDTNNVGDIVGYDKLASGEIAESIHDIDVEIFGFDDWIDGDSKSTFIEDILYPDNTSSKEKIRLGDRLGKWVHGKDSKGIGLKNNIFKKKGKTSNEKGDKKGDKNCGIQSDIHGENFCDSSHENFQLPKENGINIDLESFDDDEIIDI